MEHDLKVIARIRSPFPEKFGIPRQSGLVENLQGKIVFEPAYRIRMPCGGWEFSHPWLIWQFSEIRGRDGRRTVRPPRLGGNVRRGVFATRSPFRPNPLGLSCVKIERIEWESSEACPVIWVSGADLMDGTPIFDLKPYLPYVDCKKDALGGFSEEVRGYCLQVEIPEEIRPVFPPGNGRRSGKYWLRIPGLLIRKIRSGSTG